MALINPHFKIPLRIVNGEVEKVEQDSEQEIMQNVGMIMRYQRGERIDDPTFGIDDPNFQENGVNLDKLRAAITRGEPRARDVIERDPDSLNDLIDEIMIREGS